MISELKNRLIYWRLNELYCELVRQQLAADTYRNIRKFPSCALYERYYCDALARCEQLEKKIKFWEGFR